MNLQETKTVLILLMLLGLTNVLLSQKTFGVLLSINAPKFIIDKESYPVEHDVNLGPGVILHFNQQKGKVRWRADMEYNLRSGVLNVNASGKGGYKIQTVDYTGHYLFGNIGLGGHLNKKRNLFFDVGVSVGAVVFSEIYSSYKVYTPPPHDQDNGTTISTEWTDQFERVEAGVFLCVGGYIPLRSNRRMIVEIINRVAQTGRNAYNLGIWEPGLRIGLIFNSKSV